MAQRQRKQRTANKSSFTDPLPWITSAFEGQTRAEASASVFSLERLMLSDARTVSSTMRGTRSGVTALFMMVLLRLAQTQEAPLVPEIGVAQDRGASDDTTKHRHSDPVMSFMAVTRD
ncbi:hypothetical protein JOB18_007434 [Solea senegalensis]|uniref:Uncharacterized protein n=1 Tax=Solea senegalensis TaxID=28829 RepID=A0AAV6PUX9_SOLSE|nr:hypothetical protein JOB18_007434 [Solea senegalensis]